jgi:hypothetical protein
VGERWATPFSGVLLTEAEKQVYAGTPLRVAEPSRRRRTVPVGPVPSPR